MFDVRRRDDHYHLNREWLETDWHFSFGEYRDPDNTRFGPLRVVNHDRVAGGGGWPRHSHTDMEIVTWIIEGRLTHEDSTESTSTVGPHEIQKMSAGTGIAHSEYNASQTDSLRLLQIWIEPDRTGVEPNYHEKSFSDTRLGEGLVPVASGRNDDSGVPLEQDASFLVGLLAPEDERSLELSPERRYYGISVTGTTNWNEQTLHQGDAVRIRDETDLRLTAPERSEVMVIDLP